MRVLFARDASAPASIRLIPEIPDFALCTVEGKNGIGKTLAARLLELVSGREPYAALPHAWESLVDSLGRVTITITDLPDDAHLELVLDSSEWLDRSHADVAADPGKATLNGKIVDWPEVRSLVTVRRIAGDEGLPETLGRTMRERGLQANVGRASLRPVIENWTTVLDRLVDELEGVSADRLVELRQQRNDLAKDLDAVLEHVTKAADARTEAETTERNLRQLVSAAAQLPGVIDSYGVSWDRHQTAMDRAADVEDRLARATRANVVDKETRGAINRWDRLLTYRTRALTKVQLQEAQLLFALQIDELPSESERRVLVRNVLEEREGVERKRREADLAGEVRRAQASMELPLKQLPAAASEVAVAQIDRPVSARELLVGLQTRRKQLEDIPRPGEVAELEQQLTKLDERSRLLELIPSLRVTLQRKQDLVEEARRELAKLHARPGDQETLTELLSQLAEEREASLLAGLDCARLASQVQALIGEGDESAEAPASAADFESPDEDDADAEGVLSSQLDEVLPKVEALVAEVREWLERLSSALDRKTQRRFLPVLAEFPLGSSSEELMKAAASRLGVAEEALAQVTAAYQGHADERHRLQQSLDQASQTLAAQQLAIASVVRMILRNSDEWSSVGEAARRVLSAFEIWPETYIPPDGPLGFGATDQHRPIDIELNAASAIESILAAIKAVETAAIRTRDEWANVSAYLNSVAKQLAPRLTVDALPLGGYAGNRELLREWAESELRGQLSSPELRRELFDEADRIDVHVDKLVVTWEGSDGRKRRRPLEAFSSGEQVFAYTRAKFEQLRPLQDSATHVVVFLDEFGAFVARDRFSQLLTYVQDNALGTIADQVIVMLPWSSSEAAHAAPTTGTGEGEPFIRDDYFVVPTILDRAR